MERQFLVLILEDQKGLIYIVFVVTGDSILSIRNPNLQNFKVMKAYRHGHIFLSILFHRTQMFSSAKSDLGK